MSSTNNERAYYDALKTITKYMDSEELLRKGEKLYGVSGNEAIEMAYDNVLATAKNAIRGKRRPKDTP